MLSPGRTGSARIAGRPIEAVAIGASAGGVEAVAALLEALPRSFAPTLIVVIHLPATHESLLTAVLGQRTALPVVEASDRAPLAAGTVYVAPPAYHLLIEPERTFALSVDEPVNFSRPSIDVLFESAAYAYRDALLGIVLTGANADGAAGLAAIRSLGGLAWVQRPDTAYAPAMPAAAIETAGADRILTLEQMMDHLAALATV
jgi:two-component system chemotaxis response regulator CheB